MQTPVTKAAVRQHITYSWWKYVLIVILSCCLWSIIYTVTAYRVPENLRVDLYIANGYGDQQLLNAYLEQLRLTEYPEMEASESNIMANEDYYKAMQMTTYFAAHEGDVYLLDADTFHNYAPNEMCMPLEDYTELIADCEKAGISLDKCWMSVSETGERHLFGIPTDQLPGFAAYRVPTQNSYLIVMSTSDNPNESVTMIRALIRDMITPADPPADYE